MAIIGWRLGSELEQAIRDANTRFRYVVVSMTLPEDIQHLAEWHRMPRPRFPSFRLRWLIFFVLAGLRIRKLDADLIHTIGPTPVVPNRVDVNTVTFCHAAYHEVTAGQGIAGTSVGWRVGQHLARMLERWWFSRRVAVLAGLSEGAATELRRHYPGVVATVTPRGLDLERFKPDAGVRQRIRQEHSVGADDVVAVFVDQDHRPLKGIELAIEAFAAGRLSGDGPAVLWVLGEGNDGHASVARRLGVADRIHFLGYRSDVERFYQAADVFLLSSIYETFSRSAHEAAACGLPVVAPPLSGVHELIGADEAGIVARRDPLELAKALSVLAGNPALRARMGAAARERSRAFSRETVARRITELHESLLESR